MAKIAVISCEIAPLKKTSFSIFADVTKVNILKIDNRIVANKFSLGFCPSEFKSITSIVSDEEYKNVYWRCIELEENMRQLRETLAGVKVIVCYDKMTEEFVKQVLPEKSTDIICV